MAKSDNLRRAKANANDEFYTRLEDIEAEISQHQDYVRQFEGKTVFCNCDDPEWSNFFVFFKLHFKQLKLKKLITTHFNPDGSPSFKIEWEGEMLNDDMVNLIKTPLKGNGDFASEECVEILKEADVIVTNPPFSIARELYIPLLFEYEKKFIIIGDLNWVAYKGVFPLFKENRMAFGYNSVKQFRTPDGTMKKFGNKVWFTNLDLDKAHEPLILTKNYYGNEERYPKYDNYDAIECGKVKDIPKDYFPCWYDCPHASECVYAKTEGKTDDALCERFREATNGKVHLFHAKRNNDSATPPYANVMESSECQSLCSLTSAQGNSVSSVLEQETGPKKSELVRITGVEQTCQFQKTEDSHARIIESSFSGCRKCNGLVAVPITYFSGHCKKQFDIVGLLQSSSDEQAGTPNLRRYDDFKEMRQDMSFTGASGKKANGNPVLSGKSEKGNFLFNETTGEYVHSVFARIVLRRNQTKEQ